MRNRSIELQFLNTLVSSDPIRRCSSRRKSRFHPSNRLSTDRFRFREAIRPKGFEDSVSGFSLMTKQQRPVGDFDAQSIDRVAISEQARLVRPPTAL